MSTRALLSVDEYLHMTFDDSEPEYIDGKLVERNTGTLSHGRALTEIACELKGAER